jgi:NAD(P)-dependent dehydrogenase (short-subunit alcohol dehydrogenase family)
MDLRGRTALVTGGAVRVGRAIALALAERGAQVAITYRSSEGPARETVAELRSCGVRALAVRCNQRDPEQVRAAVREVEADLGPIDVLVNNAAIFERTPFADATLEGWDSHLEVNLRGPWLFAQATAPGMQARGQGAIINLVDIAADRPYAGYLPYSVSKAGLVALTKGLARTLAPQVRVNGIAPGAVLWPDDYSEEQQAAYLEKTPLRRSGTPEDAAAATLFLIEGSDFVTGVILPLDGGRSLV